MARIAQQLVDGRTLSFEFFPPRTVAGQLNLGRAVGALAQLKPSFASVTSGAGGSGGESARRTAAVVDWLLHQTDLEPMAHLTCVGHTRTDVATALVDYRRLGVQNILALGGDAPVKEQDVAGDYRYAIELVREVAEPGCFSVGVAAHPEVHPRSPDRATDRRHLADKLRLADFAITQFFFDVEHWVRLVDELAELDVHKPVVPGIMPITDVGQIERMAAMSGAALPRWLTELLHGASGDDVARIGIDVASRLAADLLAAGAPGLHLYTLNRAGPSREICANVQLASV